jgi:hypothetical protein
MICSFQKPEIGQPDMQSPFPANIPPPNACQSEEDVAAKAIEGAGGNQARRQLFTEILHVSAIAGDGVLGWRIG